MNAAATNRAFPSRFPTCKISTHLVSSLTRVQSVHSSQMRGATVQGLRGTRHLCICNIAHEHRKREHPY